VAGPDTLQRPFNGGVKVLISDLLANDTDPDGDALAIVGVSSNSAAGGLVRLKGNWVYYTPPAGPADPDTFTYMLTDGHCAIVPGLVTVTIGTNNSQFANFRIENLGDGSFRLSFAGIPGRLYRIQYCEDLANPTWQDLTSITADSLGEYEYVDTPPAGAPSRFYRSVSP